MVIHTYNVQNQQYRQYTVVCNIEINLCNEQAAQNFTPRRNPESDGILNAGFRNSGCCSGKTII